MCACMCECIFMSAYVYMCACVSLCVYVCVWKLCSLVSFYMFAEIGNKCAFCYPE